MLPQETWSILIAIFGSLLLLLQPPEIQAQIGTSFVLQGTVQDSSGAVVPRGDGESTQYGAGPHARG
jgi:hypothetical protein